ncbi:MAG TPA: hypothetical protein PLO37_17545 [Candidatus Hydrogenedentes bacterium]|nr:hypothetical protein [Candidatus Hydrogenedentota bacterium]HPG68653.1 hypothetical protein [Candidatus Hydrogenedentota bacterium]
MARCPYCENPVVMKATGSDKKNEVRKEVNGVIKKEVLYSCPHCDRVLGFGFFFGGLLTMRP